MSSLIEQAAERLAQLRAAGVEVPDIDAPAPGSPAAGMPTAPSPWSPPPSPSPHQLDAEFDRPGFGLPAAVPVLAAPPQLPDSAHKSRKVELNLAAIAAAGIVTPQAPRSEQHEQHASLSDFVLHLTVVRSCKECTFK